MPGPNDSIPSQQPSALPSAQPSRQPSALPSAQPSVNSASPIAQPSASSESPSAQPSASSVSPTAEPTASSASPSAEPSVSSPSPSAQPSASSVSPTTAQTSASSVSPTTAHPSASSVSPTAEPTASSASPSAEPSASSASPSKQPSEISPQPSYQASLSPSFPPFGSSFAPTLPSLPPSFSPSYPHTFLPSLSSILSAVPTLLLPNSPSAQPSNLPLLPINSSLSAESSGINSAMLYGVVAVGVVGVLAVAGLVGRYCYNKSYVEKELSRHNKLESEGARLTLAITTALANHINLQKSCLGRVSDTIMSMYKQAIKQLVDELISVSDQQGLYLCKIYDDLPAKQQEHLISLIVNNTRKVLASDHRSSFCSFFRSKTKPTVEDLSLKSNRSEIANSVISEWQSEAEAFVKDCWINNPSSGVFSSEDSNTFEVSVSRPSITATSSSTSRYDRELPSCYKNAEEIELSQINSIVWPSEVVVIDVPDYAQEASISRSVSNSQNGNS